jgi:MFS family permease
MLQVVAGSWPLLSGIFMLMVGNGLQGTLLGVRGGIEGFSTTAMSVVMSAYFVGFLFSARVTPVLIGRVGHVRVFAAMGSLISAALILYPVAVDPIAWTLLRVVVGFCFCGVYITAESWLNNASANDTRGKALAIYMVVQMGGIIAAQYLLTLGDPSGFILFIVPSVLVSISFAPILLSVSPSPAFATTRAMSLPQLFRVSPLGCVGMFLTGGVFAAMFGMSAVYGTLAGLSVPQISVFVSAFYVGGVLLQLPIGWISDRMDRRVLVLAVAAAGGVAGLMGTLLADVYAVTLAAAFLIGGLTNPLYSLLLAYTNDYLDRDQMAAASGGMLFINGLGAIFGPLIVGPVMEALGPRGYFLFMGLLLAALSAYAGWRMMRRRRKWSEEPGTSYAPVLPSTSPVAVQTAAEVYEGRRGDGNEAA